jgi:hypothetical protein
MAQNANLNRNPAQNAGQASVKHAKFKGFLNCIPAALVWAGVACFAVKARWPIEFCDNLLVPDLRATLPAHR